MFYFVIYVYKKIIFQDECYPARNLINGSQRWLSSKKQQSDVIEVEILLQKETAITFVDIGT